MSIKSDNLQKELVLLLSNFANSVKMLNGLGKTDLAKSAELLFKDLLAIAYEQKFELSGAVNSDTFDLIGEKGILIQVTSRADSDKIKETLIDYGKKEYAQKYGKIYFALIAIKKPRFNSKTFSKTSFGEFDSKEQIIGLTELVGQITSKGIDALDSALKNAQKHLGHGDSTAEKRNASLLDSITTLVVGLENSCDEIEHATRRIQSVQCHNSQGFIGVAGRIKNLIRRMQNIANNCHGKINLDIGGSHEQQRQLIEELKLSHAAQMAIFRRVFTRFSETRELALLISRMDSAQKEMEEAEGKLEKCEEEQRAVEQTLESLNFQMRFLGHLD